MRLRLILPLTTISSVILGGTLYLMAAGVPQLDPPVAATNTQLDFQVASFESQAMHMTRKYGVVLPPNYDRTGKTHYPVVILLHGGHGDERDYEDKAKLTSVLHMLYQAKRLPPTIVITPDGNDHRGSSGLWDPNYYDGKNGPMATMLGQELVKVVQQRYPSAMTADYWAIGGLSSGGWGALNIGLKYPAQFHNFFSHTGYFVDNSGRENSPTQFIRQLPPQTLKQLHIYLDAGTNDHTYLKATRSFYQVLQALGVNSTYHEFPGGHGIMGPDSGWNYWHKHLADSLAFVGQQFTTAQRQAQQKFHPALPPQKQHPSRSNQPQTNQPQTNQPQTNQPQTNQPQTKSSPSLSHHV